MILATFFVCGVRLDAQTTCTFTIDGKLANPAKLDITSRNGSPQQLTVGTGTYAVTLPAGDHVFQITAPLDDSDAGDGVLLSLSQGASVSRQKTGFEAWRAEAASTAGDPKDPWPPPSTLEDLSDSKWLKDTLASLTVIVPRSGPETLYQRFAPDLSPPPEGMLEDLGELPAADPPPLDRAGLDALKRQFASEPAFTLEQARKVYDAQLTEEQLRDLIVDLEVAFDHPGAEVAHDLAFEAGLGKTKLPPSFTFPGMDTSAVPIDPTDCRFETRRDAVGWALNAGPWFLRGKIHQPKATFRWAEDHPSRFHYGLRGDTTTKLALFADAGTGLYHSRYIGRQLAAQSWDHVIYLGDVYYAGRQKEFDRRFLGDKDFGPVIKKASFWTLNANHEMFSRGAPYLNAITARRRAQPELHEQEGSYFCLRNGTFQVIGIDTAYHEDGRHREPRLASWLQRALVEGKNKGLITILCSSNEPYDLGAADLGALYRDVCKNLPPNTIDLWVWGNVHYGAFFDRDLDHKATFLGACIGHGGYPYGRMSESSRRAPVPVRWLETEPRFPTWTGVRQDRGNNGYLTLELNHGSGRVTLKFIDWTADVRYQLTLAPKFQGGPLVIIEEDQFARGAHGNPNV